ncbi:hypothetical protein SAMD00024442_13_4 [Candidatus Symbiothrix dinenymphae]|nr:hypothetical protein SAMD00024442_13_4 [Candidatus Symbiothrix dinenymphae]
MNRFLIDTHILLWLIHDNKRLDKNIRENIEYFQHPYYVSVESLREIVLLQLRKKIKLDYPVDKMVSILDERLITILPTKINHIRTLEKLPFIDIDGGKHDDPFDRLLIAQAIAEKYTLVSADNKFPRYRECGLSLLVNSY